MGKPSRRPYRQNRVRGTEQSVDVTIEPRTFLFSSLCNIAIRTLADTRNKRMFTKFVVHRVSLMPETPPDELLALMYSQSESLTEAQTYVKKQMASVKRLIMWGRYVPEDEPRVPRSAMLADDLMIDADVGLTRDEFCDWLSSAQTCQTATAELKMVLDSVLARGDRILLEAGMTPNLTQPCYLTETQRMCLEPVFPLNAYQLVDPNVQPQYAHRTHDAAFPTYYQCMSSILQHHLLRLTAHPVNDGPAVTIHVDPTFRQLYLTAPLHDWKFHAMGPGVDEEYVNGSYSIGGIMNDCFPFIADNINGIMDRLYESTVNAQQVKAEASLMLRGCARVLEIIDAGKA